MRKKGSRCDYIKERNRNLRREFNARLGRDGRTVARTIRELTTVGADRFYVSEEQAWRYFRDKMVKKKEAGPRVENRRIILEEVRKRTMAILAENPELDPRDVLFEVVNSPAPSFYLTYRTIRTILYKNRA